MKRITAFVVAAAMTAALASCGNVEKNITVVVREQGSGTREAFDKVVTDGTHFLEEKNENGKKVYNTTLTAVQQTKTGTVLSSVANDVNAIGYISLGSVNDSVKVLRVDGIYPSEETVLSGAYTIQRPFVIMTSADTALTERCADFFAYLKSAASREHSAAAGCIFLTDASRRANAGDVPIEVEEYTAMKSFSKGDKIVVRGSTSVEKFINSAAKAYCELYRINPEDLFDIQLEGSSVGRKAVEDDVKGNVIGLSSAAVDQDDINSFNVCLDAVVVVVNKENTALENITLAQLYDVFSGNITKFREIE